MPQIVKIKVGLALHLLNLKEKSHLQQQERAGMLDDD